MLLVALKEQLVKYNSDWDLIKPVIESSRARELDYKYHWALVNSRCYYWAFGKARNPPKGQSSLPRDDCLALCPWVDYFNHDNKGVGHSRKLCRGADGR
jgi:hypothetical protein